MLEPGHEKMRLARMRYLRFPFCVGRASEPPNYLDGRKRDPDSDGGGGYGNACANIRPDVSVFFFYLLLFFFLQQTTTERTVGGVPS